MPESVKYAGEMIHSVFPVYRRLAHCDGCRMLIKEVAEDCWIDYYIQSAQCSDGAMHRPMFGEDWSRR